MSTHFIEKGTLSGIAGGHSLGLTNIIQPCLCRIKFEFENKPWLGSCVIDRFLTTAGQDDQCYNKQGRGNYFSH